MAAEQEPAAADFHTPPDVQSSVSHVDLESIDPVGIQELRTNLSENHRRSEHQDSHQTHRISFSGSYLSLTRPVDPIKFDFEKTLREIVRRRDEADIKPRTLGVVFRDLEVKGLGASVTYQPTFASTFSFKAMQSKIRELRHPPVRTILSGFDGVVKPGEMLLVLGRPGSGCTTFLKTMANMREEYYAVNGTVHYDSLTSAEIKNHYRGDVQFCPEDDVHFPSLTVEQTLSFAAKTRAPQLRAGMDRTTYTEQITDVLTTLFGLRHAKHTPVGNAAIRGVSGGEKKRVSIAEVMATRSCIGAWDNSTRGLDSSTALEYVRALRVGTDVFKHTTIVSLYQAGENLYRHFDKVCLIYEGKMAYFGPADKARQYFIDMGYEPANRQTTSDFLVSVTDPNGRTARPGITSIPRTADEFAQYFQKSAIGIRNIHAMNEYASQFVGKPTKASAYKESAQAEHSKHTLPASPYMISIPMQARAVMLRRIQIIRGNPSTLGMHALSSLSAALIVGSVFYNSPESTSAYFSRGGVLFFAVLFAALTTLAEIPSLYSQRPIVYRHKIAALYHPFIEALALTLVDIPITVIKTLVFSIILYFLVGLQRSVDQFFMTLTMKALFRAIASYFKSNASAQAVGGMCIMIMSIYTGYQIPKPSIIGALRWLTYVNPLRYGFEAILTNEFRTLNGKCSVIVPSGPGYEYVSLSNQACTTVGSVPGTAFVDGARYTLLSFSFSWSNTWQNFGITVAWGLGFLILLLLFSEYKLSLADESSVILFKQGSKAARNLDDDEERPHIETPIAISTDSPSAAEDFATTPTMTDVFSWQNINYTVPISGGEQRRLLSNVTGFVAPGKLTALMGESGAGKTTLLNVLAERTTVGVVTGDRFVNGQALPQDFQAQTGYCQQMDTHLPSATVREALLFSAQLRQPASVPFEEKKAYAEKCLVMCGLEAYGDAIVGSLGVEHRKRTTIAVELAAKPKLLLFLDEPTSGLDSQSAWNIMAFLRTLADNGQAILCTIHQPSAELFQVFDRMLLLQKGGKTVFFGDIGHNATSLISYFERNGSRRCHPDENPAEFMLDVIGAGATATSEQDWHDIWLRSDEAKVLENEVEVIHTEGRNRPAIEAAYHHEFATNWFYQTSLLLKRNAQDYWRSPTYLISKLVLNISAGLFIGFTFWKSKNSLQGTQNKLFAIYMATILSVPLSNQLQAPFIATRTVYEIRERPSRIYSWTALVTSQILVEIPWNILGSSLFFLCWYWTVGFETSRAGYTYLVMGVIFPMYYTTIGQAVAAMSPDPEIASLLFAGLFSFVIMFNGVLQPYSQLTFWKWMYRLSPFTYLIEGLLGQAIGQQPVQCSPLELVTINPPSGLTCGQYLDNFIAFAGGYITDANATSSCHYCSASTTDATLATAFNIFYSHRWRDVGFLFAFVVFNVSIL
ncbi:hypothetical protein H0H93_015242 [Arthromyces matolae]|nr:hypothetical protein H0H93_015242 [Arthromyces matolae]